MGEIGRDRIDGKKDGVTNARVQFKYSEYKLAGASDAAGTSDAAGAVDQSRRHVQEAHLDQGSSKALCRIASIRH